MTDWHLDLTSYTSNEIAEEDLATLLANLERMFEFTDRIKKFIGGEYLVFAISKQFPELYGIDQNTMMFWDRIMADPGLRNYISQRIAKQTGIQGTITDWTLIEDDIVLENPNDIATEEIVGTLENWVAISKESTSIDSIKLALTGDTLSNQDYPTMTVTLSPRAVKIARTIQKNGMSITHVCRRLDNPNKRAVRQAIYRFNDLVKRKLMTGGPVIIGHSSGTGYRWIKGVTIEIKE